MSIYSEIANNKTKTYLIFTLFLVLLSFLLFVIGKALGYSGSSLFVFAFIISLFSSVGSYYFSDKLVLAMHGAVEAKRAEYFDLYTVTENLAIGAGIPKPRVYIVQDKAPNAFATGRNWKNAVVVVTTGLLEVLDRRELEGVIAHELSHIKNYDMLVMTVVAVFVGSIVYLADFFLRSLWWGRSSDDRDSRGSAIMLVLAIAASILAPIAATLLQLAISRKREFLADASAAYLTRYPEGLALALEKIAAVPYRMTTATNATAHLFIENPFKTDKSHKKASWLMKLFSTHPPISERIAKLRAL